MTTSLLVTKQVAHLAELPLACGQRLADVAIGYETYGRPNAARDNVVLVCHFFSGSSHAAGRYTPQDPLPGWWDPLIGPGKAIDTDRWFVIAMDVPGCVRLDPPHGITTSAASIDPATGRPYGPDLPPIDIADMVEAQRRVLDQLGVGRLAAVAGPSLGAMQALEWAVRRPDEVDRLIAAIGLAGMQPREHALYRAMEDAIRLDPAFCNGRYAPDAPPTAGLAIAVKLMMVQAGGTGIPGAPPHEDVAAFEAWLEREGRVRASFVDANAWIGLLRANTRWRLGDLPLDEAVARIRARVLLVPSPDDALLPLDAYHAPLAAALAGAGNPAEVAMLPGGLGHLAGLAAIGAASDAIRRLLETP